ncbi:hypothetical protein BC938DRAFT_478280 [Jimgerdemannia flammicorona]|uniref:Uncharacterized protein n=1 Tax=Jimgerdemannia flammicorona TaxID=994334 RepID=A0A433QN44_9FUNG|nr:hypothetical protein BC938DRAFT_478280 [Jimgerdemannia flammicorona]
MGPNFKWPSSMDESFRSYVIWALGGEDSTRHDHCEGRNIRFFYNQLDAHAFDDYKNKHVLIHDENVIRFGEEEEDEIDGDPDPNDEISGPIYMLVDKSLLQLPKPVRSSVASGSSARPQKVDAQKIVADNEYLVR